MKEQVKGILIRRDGCKGLPNDQWYDEFAQEIRDVFLKGEKPPVIEDTELREIVARYATVGFTSISYEGVMKLVPLIAEAQRDDTWQKAQAIYEPKIVKARQETAREILTLMDSIFEQRAFSEYHVLFATLRHAIEKMASPQG